MKSRRFWISSASASLPEAREKDHPGGIVLPATWSVATRIKRVENATPPQAMRRFMKVPL
jgi:hypothetical protein